MNRQKPYTSRPRNCVSHFEMPRRAEHLRAPFIYFSCTPCHDFLGFFISLIYFCGKIAKSFFCGSLCHTPVRRDPVVPHGMRKRMVVVVVVISTKGTKITLPVKRKAIKNNSLWLTRDLDISLYSINKVHQPLRYPGATAEYKQNYPNESPATGAVDRTSQGHVNSNNSTECGDPVP